MDSGLFGQGLTIKGVLLCGQRPIPTIKATLQLPEKTRMTSLAFAPEHSA